MLSSALTSKGQVTIPSQIRQQLHLNPGDKIGFIVEDDHIVLFRKINDITAAFGLVKAQHSLSVEDMDKAIRKKFSHDRD